MSLLHAQQLTSLYRRIEQATTRKEVKALLAEAEHLRQQESLHERNSITSSEH